MLKGAFILAAGFILLSNVVLCANLHHVEAGYIVNRLNQGSPIELYDLTIDGDLDLRKLDDPIVNSTFIIYNCNISNAIFDEVTFVTEADLASCNFSKASFNGTKFYGLTDLSNSVIADASFISTEFWDVAFFDGTSFKGLTSFEDAKFQKDANFEGANFDSMIDFNYSHFASDTLFDQAVFDQDAYFSNMVFDKFVDFSEAKFSGDVSFFNSVFGDGASFMSTTFNRSAAFGMSKFQGFSSFGDAEFRESANFELTRFDNAAYFGGTIFHNEAAFGLANFQGLVSFSNAIFEDELNFKSAELNTVLFDNTTFKRGCRITLKAADFNRLTAPWSMLKGHLAYDGASYLSLVKNYRDLEWFDDADMCYYDYRRESQEIKPYGWSKLIDILAWTSCGYGVRPSYTIAWSLSIIIAFAYLFYRGHGIIHAQKVDRNLEQDTDAVMLLKAGITDFKGSNLDRHKEPLQTVEDYPTYMEALYFSSLVFISQAPADFIALGKYRSYVIIEGLLGWLLLALFLVTLGNLMIR